MARGIITARDFVHGKFSFQQGDAFDPNGVGVSWHQFMGLLERQNYLTFGEIIRSWEEVLEAQVSEEPEDNSKDDDSSEGTESEDDDSVEDLDSDDDLDSDEDSSEDDELDDEESEGFESRHAGGGWYEIYVDGEFYDKVQGQDRVEGLREELGY